MNRDFQNYIDVNVRVATARLRRPLDICVDYQHTSEAEMARHPFYAEYLPKYDQRYYAGTVLSSTDQNQTMLAVLRSSSQGHFQRHETERLAALLTHVKRAVELGLKLGTLQRGLNLSWRVLESLQAGVIAIRADASVIFCNETARSMAATGDGFKLSAGGVRAIRSPDNSRLQSLIAEGLRLSQGASVSVAGSDVFLARKGGRLPYIVSTLPWAAPAEAFAEIGPLVLLVIRDPEITIRQTARRIALIFGLTPAEARLAHALTSGQSLDHAARHLRVSKNTARSQLRALFGKTGTSRQPDLVRMLVLTAASIQQDR